MTDDPSQNANDAVELVARRMMDVFNTCYGRYVGGYYYTEDEWPEFETDARELLDELNRLLIKEVTGK